MAQLRGGAVTDADQPDLEGAGLSADAADARAAIAAWLCAVIPRARTRAAYAWPRGAAVMRRRAWARSEVPQPPRHARLSCVLGRALPVTHGRAMVPWVRLRPRV